MEELVRYSETILALRPIIWCFYPLFTLILLDLLMNNFNDDDDDDGGGQLLPVLQKAN